VNAISTRPACIALCAVLLAGCASAPPPSPLAQRAEAGMQRGAQAYARGDLPGAQRAYQDATRLYESVADTDGRARAQLSLARVMAGAGDTAGALALIDHLLAEPDGLGSALRPLALGRTAGLLLALGRQEEAAGRLASAQQACAGACGEAGALDLIGARLALARGDTASALARTDACLARLSSRDALHAEGQRLRANALLDLRRSAEGVAAAEAALVLDRAAGRPDAVGADLELLARLHASLGDAAAAEHFQRLAERARNAQRGLLGPVRPD